MTRVLIVGGGITGLAAAQRLAAHDVPFTLVERDARPGGKILSERVEGFLVEGGPDCFLSSKPGGVALARELGIDGLLQGTDQAHRRSYIKRRGRLYPLPDGITGLVPSRLGPLLTTRLLSPAGRLRAGLEALVPRGADDSEESIAQFASRRFGREAYQWVVEPLLSGVYAGDGARLSLAATFPQLRVAEQEAGGVLRSAWRRRRATQGERGGFLSFPDGMEQLVRSIVARFPASAIRSGTRAQAVLAGDGVDGRSYRVRLADGHVLEADHIVLATPSFTSAELVEPLDPGLAVELAGITFVSTATVTLAYAPGTDPPSFAGSGYICPRAGGGAAVAVTWASNKFRDRAPAQATLIRVFFGRAGDETWAEAPDDALIAEARREVGGTCGIATAPLWTRIFRWPRALPQYEIGHLGRVARIITAVRRHPGLHIAGASFRGVGIPDCISSGWAAADLVLTDLGVVR